jgi:hypothetical protein
MSISTNLFSGNSGNTDGTAVGHSREITLASLGFTDPYILPPYNEVVTIHVVGVWDGAEVLMEKYLGGVWYNMEVSWLKNRMLEGLLMEDVTAIRMNLISVGASTNLKVFAGHGFALV